MTNMIERQTLAVLVDNEAGVLSQISLLFSRKGYNIESLAVGATEDPKVSRITIEVYADEERITLLVNQLRKLFPVHSIKRLPLSNSIRRELVLIKVRTVDNAARSEILQIASVFRTSIIDVSVDTLTLAVIGDESKVDAMQKMLEMHGILELVRTGVIALERGKDTINDDTKVKGEFNYGKNVL